MPEEILANYPTIEILDDGSEIALKKEEEERKKEQEIFPVILVFFPFLVEHYVEF
jgi:hypothetical protein